MRTHIAASVMSAVLAGVLHSLPTDLALSDRTVAQGETVMEAASVSVTAGPNYIVAQGADVTFAAGEQVGLQGGFSVRRGASFRASTHLLINEQLPGSQAFTRDAYIAGALTIPQGVALTIADGVRVVFLQGEQNLVLTVQGLLTAQGAIFTTNATAAGTWNGIRVLGGTVVLSGCTIEFAGSGISLSGATSAAGLVGCTLRYDLVGVHLLDGILSVDNGVFANNSWYDIKVESSDVPHIARNTFLGDAYTYYDPSLTILSASEINDIEGNFGNFED